MLNTKKLLTKVLNGFRGCDSSRYESFGTSTTVKPTRDGWLSVVATCTVSSGLAPVARIGDSNTVFAEGVGVIYNGGILLVGCPVKAGYTYTVSAFRCTINSVTNYY